VLEKNEFIHTLSLRGNEGGLENFSLVLKTFPRGVLNNRD
jgi:hypothetical protein